MNPAEKIKDWTGRSRQFYGDVRGEVRKVSWPNREEVLGTTVVVIIAVFFFGLYFFLVDSVLGFGLGSLIDYFSTGG